MKSPISRFGGLCALFLLLVVGMLPTHAENVSQEGFLSSRALPFADVALNYPENGTVVVLNHLQYRVIIPGDNLTWLSKRFSVRMSSILELNPKVSSRTNPARKYWIYLGETITIPVYIPEVKAQSEVGGSSLVAVPLSFIEEKEQEISNLKGELAGTNDLLTQTNITLEAIQKENELMRLQNETMRTAGAYLFERNSQLTLEITEATSSYNQVSKDLAHALTQIRNLQDETKVANGRAMTAGLIALLVMVLFACWLLNRKNKDPKDPENGEPKKKDNMPTGPKLRDNTSEKTYSADTIDPDIRESIRNEEARQGQKNELASVLSKDDSRQDQYAIGDLTEAPKVREVHERENRNSTPFKGGISSRGELNEQLDEGWVKEIFGEVNEVDKVQIREFFGEESRERAVEDLRKVFCEEGSKGRTAEDLMEELRHLNGGVLRELMSMPLTTDEDGKRPVTLGKIKSFMDNKTRAHLSLDDYTPLEWQELFSADKKKREEERKAAQTKGGSVVQMPHMPGAA